MMATYALALTFGTMATLAIADDRARPLALQDLLDRGLQLIAEAQLVGAVDCEPQSAAITLEHIRQRSAQTCFAGKVTYGSFKRLKGDDSEFVCVSFRDWACYQSPNLN